ncbi:MAG TPA: GDP-mannose 4,6-dehydratase [Casimicrobiaceae bacterium]|nr:GDP-mannose 4,6-dehydratase [Casimicrobiaceae bacterium]
MKRLLVTGRHGFVGSTLIRMVGNEPALATWTVAPLAEQFEILDARSVAQVVRETAPEAVLHLAARSSVAESLHDPEGTINVNLFGTLNLLRALADVGFTGPIVFVSSGDVYGRVPEDALPIDERRIPMPRNPYAVSKLAAEALCYQWFATAGLRVVIARPFNHIGPGQGEQFAMPAFARQINEIRNGGRKPVVAVGDVDVTRDFTDVRDIILAYFSLLDRGRPGETYNVCSGVERTVRSMLERLIELAQVDVEIVKDETRMRPAEHRRAVGDPAKIFEATGWRATMPLDESLAAMLDASR